MAREAGWGLAWFSLKVSYKVSHQGDVIMKKILKLQKLSSDKNNENTTNTGSQASLLLCGDSSLSVTTCN